MQDRRPNTMHTYTHMYISRLCQIWKGLPEVPKSVYNFCLEKNFFLSFTSDTLITPRKPCMNAFDWNEAMTYAKPKKRDRKL